MRPLTKASYSGTERHSPHHRGEVRTRPSPGVGGVRSESGVVVSSVYDLERAQVGSREAERWLSLGSPRHIGRPEVHGQGLAVRLFEAVDPDHGAPTLRVADPYGCTQARRVADVPGVGEVVGGAGLAGGGSPDLLVEIVEHARRPVLHHAAENLVKGGGLVPGHHALPSEPVVVEVLALAVAHPLYALDGIRVAADAAGGEGRVGGGHLQGTDADAQ